MFVRISKGRYKPELHTDVTARLDASSRSLVPAITAMPGCLSYYSIFQSRYEPEASVK